MASDISVGIDLDGVLANFNRAFIEFGINKLWPGRLHPEYENKNWEWSEVLSPGEKDQAFTKMLETENVWLKLDAYPEAVGDLMHWLISQRDRNVYICTSRSPSVGMTVAKQSDMWIQSCNIQPYHNFLSVVVCPNPANKARFYEAAGVRYSLDDKVETVIECGLIDSFEHQAYLMRTSANRGAPLRNKVSHVRDFLARVK